MPPETIMENADKPKAKLCQVYYEVLGVRVDPVQIPKVVVPMEKRIARRESGHCIAVTGTHGVAGLLFEPGNPAARTAKVDLAWNHPKQLASKGRAARAESEAKYEPSKNYEIWMQCFGRVRRG